MLFNILGLTLFLYQPLHLILPTVTKYWAHWALHYCTCLSTLCLWLIVEKADCHYLVRNPQLNNFVTKSYFISQGRGVSRKKESLSWPLRLLRLSAPPKRFCLVWVRLVLCELIFPSAAPCTSLNSTLRGNRERAENNGGEKSYVVSFDRPDFN